MPGKTGNGKTGKYGKWIPSLLPSGILSDNLILHVYLQKESFHGNRQVDVRTPTDVFLAHSLTLILQ
jgi:hypothetical protein